VRIIGVLPDSAARQAGLSPGDVVMSYGEDRLYSARTLRGLTRAGEAGELVPVDVLRDGQRVQAWLPRGPMGVTVTAERALPQSD
jgi:S1-C subfamily serine protease